MNLFENLQLMHEAIKYNITIPFSITHVDTSNKGTYIFDVDIGTSIKFKFSVYVNDNLDIIEVRYCNLNDNIAEKGITLEKSHYSIYKYNNSKKHQLISSCLRGIILKELIKI